MVIHIVYINFMIFQLIQCKSSSDNDHETFLNSYLLHECSTDNSKNITCIYLLVHYLHTICCFCYSMDSVRSPISIKSRFSISKYSPYCYPRKKNNKKKNKKKQNQKYGFRSVRGLMKLETQIPGSSRGYVILTLYWVFDIVIFGVVM